MPNTNFQTLHQMGGAINSFVKQATGRDNMQNIDMEHITVAQNHYYDDVDISGRVVSFNAGAAGIPLDKCLVQIEPVQEGAGDPSPDNVRPISGWTGAKVTRAGKNLLKLSEWETESNSGITIGTDNISIVNKRYQENLNRYNMLNLSACVFSFHVKTVALNDSRASFAVYADGIKLNGSGTTGVGNITLDSIGTEKDITLTVPNGTEYISFGGWAWTGEVQISNVQLELGSTATSYEPYQGKTYDITLPSEAGTVYGGTLDATSGVLTVDMAEVDMGTLDWATSASYGFNRFSTTIAEKANGQTNLICGAFAVETDAVGANQHDNTVKGISSTNAIYVRCDSIADASSFKTAMSGVQLVYELATPLTYQLTPQEVKTLLGTNNVWADTGDIEVKFKNIKEFF